MKDNEPGRYESDKYRKLLSKTFNDLGEYYYTNRNGDILAEKYFIDSIKVDAGYGRAYYNLGNYNMLFKRKYDKAKENYLLAESKGFINDPMTFNLGWLNYRDADYYEAYKRINVLAEKFPSNNNLKFFIGTILYKLEKFDLSESILFESLAYFNDLAQIQAPLQTDIKDHRIILDNLTILSNNLGAVYQKKYETTRKNDYLIRATKYYADSAIYFDKATFEEQTADGYGKEGLGTSRKNNGNHNLKMVLHTYLGVETPIVYEFFPVNFMRSM